MTGWFLFAIELNSGGLTPESCLRKNGNRAEDCPYDRSRRYAGTDFLHKKETQLRNKKSYSQLSFTFFGLILT